MKKLILFLACSMLLFLAQSRAQTAQNFSAVDIKGNTQNLYSKLNSGKIVILVFFSTDNKNSFSYHNGGFLPNLYASHGPSGDNQLEIFYIEGDPNTSDNCIFGASNCSSSNNTTQDWTVGIDFPIISSPQLAQSYNVTSFPSVFYICPGKKYEKVPPLTATSLWARASQCPLPAGDNNVGIYYFDPGLPYNEICGTTVIKPKFTIVNTGQNPINGLNVYVRLNDLVLDTIPITGTLYHLDERVIIANDIVLQDTGTLTLSLTPLLNEVFLQDNSRSKSFTKAIKFTDRQIKVRIRTDSYGSETYWELKDLSNQQIVAYNGNTCVGPSGGGIYNPDCTSSTTYGNDQQNTVSITLPHNGCYSFNIVDAVGDGMLQCSSNNPCGYYVYDSNTFNYQNAPIRGDDFMEGRQYQFEIDAPVDTHTPATEETIVSTLKITPNPFSDLITVQFEASTQQNIRFTVYSSTGQLMYSEGSQSIETGLKTWSMNTTNWPSGVYFAVVQSQDNATTQTFVKQKN
jgi:Secretion system C-terminal sorting domain